MMACPTPPGGLTALPKGAPIPHAGAVSVTFPEAYPGYSKTFFTEQWWRDRLSKLLASQGVGGFQVTCVEPVAQGTLYGEPVTIWMVHFRFLYGQLTGEKLRVAMEQALDRPNFDEMTPVRVGLHATYAAHQTEEGPVTRLVKRISQPVLLALAAVFLLQVVQTGTGLARTLRRKEA